MTDRSITKLAIENLELLFTPHGLPIIDKGADAPTTSIAILGDAGAGKTTLAVALAHAIARELEGAVLFLSTELAPTEIKYKVSLLGLGAGVFAWKHRDQAKVGDVVGQHVALMELPEGSQVRARALEAAWQLLEENGLPVRVRCVVIDAFPLPDASSATTRDEIVGLVQALESRGISVVIIQESSGATDYVPFITDLVFELKFSEDPDTGERIRKLACPKSRYFRSLVGPHDTGVVDDHVAVWPDPLAVHGGETLASPTILLPTPVGDDVVMHAGGAIVVGDFRHQQALRRIPGLQKVLVTAGPLSTIVAPDFETTALVHDGAAALIWAIWRAALAKKAALVLVENLESLLRRRRFRAPLEAGLVALRRRGLVVVVRSPELGAIADFVDGGGYLPTSLPVHAHRTAGLWIAIEHWPDKARARIQYHLRRAEVTAEQVRVDALNAAIGRESLVTDSKEVSKDRVWLDALRSKFASAVRAIYAAAEVKPLTPLWHALLATLGNNDMALESIVTKVDDMPALLGFVVRGIAQRHQWERLDEIVDRSARRHEFPPWLSARLKADARIDGGDLERAASMLASLSADAELPAVHRALVLHNRGVARAKLGHLEGARADWKEALSINPELEIAQHCLSGEVVP